MIASCALRALCWLPTSAPSKKLDVQARLHASCSAARMTGLRVPSVPLGRSRPSSTSFSISLLALAIAQSWPTRRFQHAGSPVAVHVLAGLIGAATRERSRRHDLPAEVPSMGAVPHRAIGRGPASVRCGAALNVDDPTQTDAWNMYVQTCGGTIVGPRERACET